MEAPGCNYQGGTFRLRFSRCKFDPSYVSTTSFDDSLNDPYINGSRSALKNKSAQILNTCKGRPSIESRVSTSSLARGIQTPDMFPQTDYSPINISPLDANKLWEESQGRLGDTPQSGANSRLSDINHWGTCLPFGSDTALNRNSTEDSVGLSMLPGASTVAGHLSLSYSTIDRTGLGNNQSGFSESASSKLDTALSELL